MTNETYTADHQSLSTEDRLAIDQAQAAYVQRGTEIGAEMDDDLNRSMTPEEQRDLFLGDLRGLLFLVGVEDMLRFLPDRLKNARRNAGETVRQFENRVNRMEWQLSMLRKLEGQAPAAVMGALADLRDLEYSKYDDRPDEKQQTANDALLAQAQVVQGAFRNACNKVMWNEKVIEDREQRALARAQRTQLLTDRNERGDEQLGDLDRAQDVAAHEEGASTAEPGRLVLAENLSAADLLTRQPVGDQIEALDTLYSRLMPYKATLENDIEGWNYSPRPMEFYSVRNPDTGEYEGAFSYSEARELARRYEKVDEERANERRKANALARAALLG